MPLFVNGVVVALSSDCDPCANCSIDCSVDCCVEGVRILMPGGHVWFAQANFQPFRGKKFRVFLPSYIKRTRCGLLLFKRVVHAG